jgi:hypothetical protein
VKQAARKSQASRPPSAGGRGAVVIGDGKSEKRGGGRLEELWEWGGLVSRLAKGSDRCTSSIVEAMVV